MADPKVGKRFVFGGVGLSSVADALPPEKYASALNIRPYSPTSVRGRPGYNMLFHCGNNAVTDVASYSAIETDNFPQYLARDSAGNIWLGSQNNNVGVNVGNLAGPQGDGASMLQWRPQQSPQAWMYVASQNDYQKFSAPGNNNNAVAQYKVGIAEGQIPLQAAPVAPLFTNFTGNNSNWTASGTASNNVTAGNILTDTAGAPLPDPVIATRRSIPVSIPYYLTGSLVNFGNNTLEVQDVIPPIANTSVTAIRYAANNNGNCVIVCGPLPISEGPTTSTILGSLRRGAIVNIGNNNSNENVLVLNALSGPSGQVQFECSTNATRSANDAIAGVRCIVVDGNYSNNSITQPSISTTIGAFAGFVNTALGPPFFANLVSGTPFVANMTGGTIIINNASYLVQSVISPSSLQLANSAGNQNNVAYSFPGLGGVGTISQNLATNPFSVGLGGSPTVPSQDDYIRLVALINNIADFDQLQILFVCGTYGSFSFVTTSVEIVDGELAIIEFPISALVPTAATSIAELTQNPSVQYSSVGNSITLADCTQVQIAVTTTGSQAFAIASLCISGGALPDIGATGAPYTYRLVGRSVLTGASGNPGPTMRYGVSPRRQNVLVPLPTVAAALPANDPQVTVWDVYRDGGSVTSTRYIGSGTPGINFTDMYFDDTAEAGAVLPTDNYEPFPSVDVPWTVTSGAGIAITVTGTQIVVAGYSAWPATIQRWLPGTIILLNGQTAYTLRKRPTLLSSTSYLFDIEESAGNPTVSTLAINEPNVARQIVPYVWGPDANGYFFGTGDPLRPGVFYFATPNSPDVTAPGNTLEPSTPSEPGMNGVILDGLSYGATSDRWWRFFPAFSATSVFEPFQVPVPRGLSAPRGVCTDKQFIYFWAKDGIWKTNGGGGESLTDADLYFLFPHDENTIGQNIVRNGVTYYAPDYSRASTFRLAEINGYLYADYQDSTGTPRTLVCLLSANAWFQDQYANQIISRCVILQPAGTLSSSPNETYGMSVMSDNAGNVFQAAGLTNDNGTPISCLIAGFEWDGEPERQSGTWESFYLDAVPSAVITAMPVSFGQGVATPTVIGASSSRQLTEIQTAAGANFRFLGLQLAWTDDYTKQSGPTILYTWRNFADPDSVYSWRTQQQTFGLQGYMHCGRLEIVWSSTAVVTLNLTALDGTSSATMTIPSTGGAVQKILVTPTFNKGQLLSLSATSTNPFWMSVKDTRLWLRQWGSRGPYVPYQIGREVGVKP